MPTNSSANGLRNNERPDATHAVGKSSQSPSENEQRLKSHRKELWFNIPSRRGFVNITSQVEEALRESGIQEGMVLVKASPSLHNLPVMYTHVY